MKSGINVLVVDDEQMMRTLVEKILAKEGYQVMTAEDGEAALDVMEANRVDIVVTDIKMPKMNGFDLLKAVKTKYPTVAVIIMTAFGDTYTVKDALLLGADEYVTKPFKSHEMALVVERAYWRIMSATKSGEKVQ